MKFLFSWILSIFLCSFINAGQIHNFNGNEYFFSYPMKKTWYQAMRFCGFHDMQLLSIDNQEENNFIANLIRTTPEYFTDTSNFWTSGNDLGDQRQFKWATHGKSMTFTDWAPAQPNHAWEEDCIEVSGKSGFKWNDASCKTNNYFICEPRVCRDYFKSA